MKLDRKKELVDITLDFIGEGLEESEEKKLVAAINELCDGPADFWLNIGVIIGGPFYYVLKSWILDSLRDDRRIFFVSESGYYMFQVFKRAGIDNIEYLDMTEIEEDNQGLFDSDAYVFCCDWNGSLINHIDRLKKDALCDHETYYLCPGILNSEDSIKNVHGQRYKTYFFDFYKDYGFQRDVKNNIDLFEILFSAPNVGHLCGEDRIIFGKLYDNESKRKFLEGIFTYFDAVERVAENGKTRVTHDMLIGYLGRMGLDLNEEAVDKNTEKTIPEEGEYHLENEYDLIKYRRWLRKHQKPEREIELEYQPKFSIVVPVYNTADDQLRGAIDSILNQTYKNYEAILVDDCSTWENVVPTLKKYEINEHVKVIYRQSNGHISMATNDGIALAKGDFLVFMDCDDLIAPNAFYEMAKKLNENPDLDFIYTDEDKITEDGKIRHMPFFKPDWSPDLFWSMNYTNHLSAYRMDVVRKIGGLRSEYNGSQDYDFVLRFMEHSDNSRVGHISKILYHWRERKESVAFTMGSKNYAVNAAKRAKEDALKRRNIAGHVEFISDVSQYRVVYDPVDNPGVSIIIPSKDNYTILKQCIDSIKAVTTYKNYEILVVDNGSSENNRKLIHRYLTENDCKYVYEEFQFNFSKMCNIGAEIAQKEYYLFLNDDIEIFQEDWLDRLVGQAIQENVGVVGAKLFYPMSTIIQHAGVAKLKEGPGHSFAGKNDKYVYYNQFNRSDYNVSCVTGACLMIDKEVFNQVGGFDEGFAVAYNDVDLCFKVHELGYYLVIRQDVYAYHYESLSRGYDFDDDDKFFRLSRELQRLYRLHPLLVNRDPFLNHNLHCYYGEEIDLSNNIDEVSVLDDFGSVPHTNALIDKVVMENEIRIYGWAFLNDRTDNADLERNLIFEDIYGYKYKAPVVNVRRKDLVEAFGGRKDLLMCGFECIVDTNSIRMDVIPYRLGIQIIDTEGISHIYWEENYRPVMRKSSFRRKYCSLRELTDFDFHEHTYDIRYYFDTLGKSDEGVRFNGWAFCNGDKHYQYKMSLILQTDGGPVYECELLSKERSDVAIAIPEVKFLCNSGFDATFSDVSFKKNKTYNMILRFINVVRNDDIQDIRVGELDL
ncbi:Glycosyltransferase, GT2 family [Oribacterium sp. KHPX15]|uniref:glycosyltransferase family 2 protein n=1 Tax=Oribacterium sp. KHPX15 TaxID=1855342 RepID=UPI0008981085|nr:glycosyltransferase family 2 protein [Oribacterium sp. KHPX15]SEA48522.1 Glycosyltransferase, GT2 family [Oribacterium sp. KHPX15]